MYDAHIHLQDSRLNACRQAVNDAAVTAGVCGACCCGTAPDDWAAVAALSSVLRTPTTGSQLFFLLPAFGVHPWYVRHLPPDWYETLELILAAHPAAPVGEIGLDGLKPEIPRDLQRRMLDAQFELAVRLGRPVVLHGVRAWGELVAALKPFVRRMPGFVAHGFSSSADVMRDILALGGYVSLAGSVCNSKATHVRAIAAMVPVDRLLVETDTPDIFPLGGVSASDADPHLNQPANLALVVKAVAEVRGVLPAEIAAVTTDNARRVFSVASAGMGRCDF